MGGSFTSRRAKNVSVSVFQASNCEIQVLKLFFISGQTIKEACKVRGDFKELKSPGNQSDYEFEQ